MQTLNLLKCNANNKKWRLSPIATTPKYIYYNCNLLKMYSKRDNKSNQKQSYLRWYQSNLKGARSKVTFSSWSKRKLRCLLSGVAIDHGFSTILSFPPPRTYYGLSLCESIFYRWHKIKWFSIYFQGTLSISVILGYLRFYTIQLILKV